MTRIKKNGVHLVYQIKSSYLAKQLLIRNGLSALVAQKLLCGKVVKTKQLMSSIGLIFG